MKKILILICTFSLSIYGMEIEKKERIPIIYTALTDGTEVIDINSELISPIASLTKVMNVIVAKDEISKGKFSLSDKVTFDKYTAFITGGSISAWSGDNSYTLEDLLKAQMIFSSNNAAYATAKHIGLGDIDNFIILMNKKARELGMYNTYFASPAGLPPRLNKGFGMDISTAKDLYLLAKYAIENTDILEYSNKKSITFPNSRDPLRMYYNRITMLGEYGVVGLKTGYHDEAGFNIIIISKIGDSTVISISLNSETEKQRYILQREILSKLSERLEKIVDKDKAYYLFEVKDYKNKILEGYIKEDINLINLGQKFEYDIKLNDINDNINIDDEIATLYIKVGDEVILTKPIFAKNENRKLNWFEKILRYISFGLY
ncbi:D-alanyl-D-alanine carboxypeptidase family protein [Streptobacillus moniliformis]|uniref:D-alanyl-D-alanine carboxypeptidase family protein n=1 Tax=Streptobacillus moniliformis TaxID=34105 RepID=UPI0007E2E4F5|nr:serine hydrolase [Streptobacillus moniliformis]